MHKLLAEKGFEKKNEDEIRKMKEEIKKAVPPGVKARPKVPVLDKPVRLDKQGVRGGAAAATTTAAGQKKPDAVDIGKKDGDEAEDDDGEDDDDSDEDDDDIATDDDTDTGTKSDEDAHTSKVKASSTTAQVRKTKVAGGGGTKGMSPPSSSQFVLALSTFCVVLFGLLKVFPGLRILVVPITRLFGGHQHAR